MYFDRNRATLIASPTTLTALAQYFRNGEAPADGLQPWEDGDIANDGKIDPTVVGIVEILERPTRSIMLERFDGERVTVTFVAWDRRGRATIMDGAVDDLLSITATQFKLLPALLTQALRLNPGSPPAARPALETTAGTVEQVLIGSSHSSQAAAGEEQDDLSAVLGSFRHAWRASGSWHTKTTDASITVMSCGPEGLWTVEHGAMAPATNATPETPVQLVPSNPTAVTRLLGDVVTGRTRQQQVPAPDTALPKLAVEFS